ncbi:Alpha/Beta hydrolase protein [Chaetomium fimeti]|uniref:Alpha/Beta hydrolase protein n=1 Tax=Chaetomium fimeti TaxID=1854472 RepID=A0AAE0H8V3_9PEZI|nr:Alpha/Beta hydrolase protein [Chaetomium fimeti]
MHLILSLLVAVLAVPALGYVRPPLLNSRYQRHPLRELVRDQIQSPFLNERSSGELSHLIQRGVNLPTWPGFAVNGSAIPMVDFDVGESYAGLLPTGNDTSRQLYFWFFPSTNPVAQEKKEILIYLTGGPGCSSIGELLQVNGPISWQPGTYQPIQNRWSWHRLTNVVWIDQPVGTGFSQGTPMATSQADVAQDFLGFWKNFVDTFTLQGYQVHVTGSSYGGMYAPYISSAMLDRKDTGYFNVSGMAIWDGLYSKFPLTEDIPVARYVDKWKAVLPFNDTFRATIKAMDEQCGYTAYLDEFLVYPPKGPQPSILPGEDPATGMARPECALYAATFLAALELNPCLYPADVTSRCPVPFDPIGFTGGTFTLPPSFPTPYFDLPAVKAAINAPRNNTTWAFCQDMATSPVFVGGVDTSLNAGPGSQPVLPRVIEHTGNVILGHGSRDFLLLPEGSLLAIQNLTWCGEMGFRERPGGVLVVPRHGGGGGGVAAGAGVVGSSHVERGLTWFEAAMGGHVLGMDQPAVTFRMVEVLLGRVEGFESTVPFTVDMGGGVGVGQPR